MLHDFLVEAAVHIGKKFFVAEDKAGFEQGSANRHVAPRLDEAFVDRAGRMADLLLQVPEQIEHGFGHPLAPIVVIRGQQEKQIDVGAGRQRRATIAADSGDHEAPGCG